MFDPGLSGFIGNLPDSTAGFLRFKCVLTLTVGLLVVSALKPVYVGRGCHNELQGVCVHDVEATASVHEHLGEESVADDGVATSGYHPGCGT